MKVHFKFICRTKVCTASRIIKFRRHIMQVNSTNSLVYDCEFK